MSTATRLEAEAKYPKHTASGTDHKAWAKQIVYRAEHGDKTVSKVQEAAAREALKINQGEGNEDFKLQGYA